MMGYESGRGQPQSPKPCSLVTRYPRTALAFWSAAVPCRFLIATLIRGLNALASGAWILLTPAAYRGIAYPG